MNVVIMSLAGPSLSWLRRHCPQQRMSFSSALRVAFYCMNAIEDLHCIGFIHRDIKASNFALGYYASECRRIRMLDFGFARCYLSNDKNGILHHRRPRKRAPFLGTDRYCSPNVHRRIEQGRRDDCWSWLFMLVELMYGKLPWRELTGRKILKCKEDSLTTLFKHGPIEMYQALDHIQDLRYESRPDYEFFRSLIIKICQTRGIVLSEPFDWEKGGCAYEAFCDSGEITTFTSREKSQEVAKSKSKISESPKAEAFEKPATPKNHIAPKEVVAELKEEDTQIDDSPRKKKEHEESIKEDKTQEDSVQDTTEKHK
uniref:Protein kinase domain-containing protein n=1 Tax=Panagrolaimus sp. JU765 TaxID=591449 RepID=A0AC34QBF6_9BILA